MRKPGVLFLLLGGMLETVAAHSQPGTPGIDLHHFPVWGWLLVVGALLGIVYVMYVKSHEKPLNPFDW
ncbi:MAG: hypothetical protein SVU32_09525 [Candidatus Nanohaloarchaea archaeon]|nr:hypothetical protein [Candidatus Nanohaloarchaea archaeon]